MYPRVLFLFAKQVNIVYKLTKGETNTVFHFIVYNGMISKLDDIMGLGEMNNR